MSIPITALESMTVKQRGELSETAFIYAAQQRNLHILEPRGDNLQYDLAIDNGSVISKVQVKSTSLKQRTSLPRDYGHYRVTFRHGFHNNLVYSKDDFDFLAAHIQPRDIWYIIPSQLIAGKKSIQLYTDTPLPTKPPIRRTDWEPYREAWYLFK